jgi:hypothetical protein
VRTARAPSDSGEQLAYVHTMAIARRVPREAE